MNFERRVNAATEIRTSAENGEMRIEGYAARYGVLSSDLGGFKERLAKRSFDRVLSTSPDVCCLLNHDANHILGRTSSGTLKLEGTDEGLRFSCLLPNTEAGRSTHEAIKRGDLAGCSFAFGCEKRSDGTSRDEWEEIEAEEDDEDLGLRSQGRRRRIVVRTVNDYSALHDVSPCAYPSYPGTSVAARSVVVPAEVRSEFNKVSENFNRAINEAALVQYTRMQRERLSEITAELEAPAKRYIDPSYRERT